MINFSGDKMNIKFSGSGISKQIIKSINELGFTDMTDIQAKTLPHILKGKDILAQAKTGSGKTIAFGIGVIEKIDVKNTKNQALILCPTRELAEQVSMELRKLAKFTPNLKVLTIYGGVPFSSQENSLKHGAHVIVGTPGRILKHLNKNSFNLEFLKTLVIDEAHRMLDMGFIEEITKVIRYAPKKRQTLLFSATYPPEIMELSSLVQKNALNIQTISTEKENEIKEYFFETARNEKLSLISKIFTTFKPENAIIFTNTKIEAQNIAKFLKRKGHDALALHGDLEQYQRNDAMIQFLNKSCRIMVATDIAARGLDIDNLSLVINYDFPHDEATYTHRIGRTGRAGKTGLAFTLYTPQEAHKAEIYQNPNRIFNKTDLFTKTENYILDSLYATVVIEGGKKNKIRKGDILGALTKDAGLDGNNIGRIDIYDKQSFVAIDKKVINKYFLKIKKARIKGKKFPVWMK